MKHRNKKIHKTNQKMVSVLSNINITMYHVFIVDCDKNFMPPLLNFNVKSLDGEDDTTLVPIV